MADFASVEETEGLRLAWNVWPNNRIEATKCVLPFGALYTPTKALANLPVSSKSGCRAECLAVLASEGAPTEMSRRYSTPDAHQLHVWHCCSMANAD